MALGGYGLIAMGASLTMIKWVKGFENGLDYSLMNTTKGALFLVTSREEKYKGKAAAETFFYRTGDALAGVMLVVGVSIFGFTAERLALINVGLTLVWILLCALLLRQYRKIKERAAAGARA